MTFRRLLYVFGILALVSLMLLMLYVCAYLGLGIAHKLKSLQRDLQSVQVILQELTERKIEINDLFPSAYDTVMEVTAYCPLGSDAVEGMDYSGNQRLTANGETPVAGETAAAALPFGTVVYIEGIGLRRINDRGGMIRKNCVDVVVSSRKEAFAIGRSKKKVTVLWSP